MTPEEEIHRAERARQLLEDPLMKEAFSELEKAFLHGIHTSGIKDTEMRERLCQLLMTTARVKQYLQSTMETGRMAQEQLKQQTMFDRVKNVVRLN